MDQEESMQHPLATRMSTNRELNSSNHSLFRRGEMEDDSATMPPPSLNRQQSSCLSSESVDSFAMQCPPPVGPLPEPSALAQQVLGDMFSQQATLRNYCADAMQAFMMQLDDQRLEQERLQQEEEASLALAKALAAADAGEGSFDTPNTNMHRHMTLLSSGLSCSTSTISTGGNSRQQQQTPSLDLGSICPSETDSSSLEIPDFFTTTEARFSKQELVLFQDDIMPYPLQEKEKDQKKRPHRHSSPGCMLRSLKKAPPSAPPGAVAGAACAPCATDGSNKKKSRDRQCIICHRSTSQCRLRMRKLSCGHHFCRSCIDRWLTTNDSCPYCRQKVSERTRQKVRRQNSVGATTA